MMELKSLSTEDAKLLQNGLKTLGFYDGSTRGLPGPKTEAAYDAWLYLARCYWATMQGDQARAAVLGSLLLAPDCKESLLFMAEISFPEQAKAWNRFAEVATNEGCLFVRRT